MSSTTTITPAQTQTALFPCPDCATTERYRLKAESGDTMYQGMFSRRQGRSCGFCGNAGVVVVDSVAIEDAITSSRGKNKGSLRASRPKLSQDGGIYGAAYVWRMIRFHNGMDMHMPVTAYDYLGMGWTVHEGERPLIAHLDCLVDSLGEKMFGKMRMLSGAASWGRVLGMEHGEDMAASKA